jgi:hypothetical protein
MIGIAPANQLRLGLHRFHRVKPETNPWSGETIIGEERAEHPARLRA